jgi:excinuclease ABC subunit C
MACQGPDIRQFPPDWVARFDTIFEVAPANPQVFEVHPESVDQAVACAPQCAAVFLVWPREGRPYLGHTRQFRRRLKRLLGQRAAPSRMLNLRELATRVEFWPVGSNLEASLQLYTLAVRHFPESYPLMLKLRMPHFVKVVLSNAFPRLQVTARLGGGRSLYYGPFRSRASAEAFESQVLDLFQVRRCLENLAPSPAHPGCIYGEMNLCLRPCQQAVSPEEYATEVQRLVHFLDSGGRSVTEPLEASRDRLSQAMDFEAAARLHKQLEKIQQVLRLRDDLVCEAGRLGGVAVTPSAAAGACELWFLVAGGWQPPVHFGFEISQGKAVSLDQRLREVVAGLAPRTPSIHERQEHLALLARWYYSSWRDGEWLAFESLEQAPYRRLVRAISRVVSQPA